VMSDRIGVLRAGKLVQLGTPEDIYTRPADRFVSEFVGEVNVVGARRNDAGEWIAEDSGKRLRVIVPPDLASSDELALVIRPEFMRFVDKPNGADNTLEGAIYNEYSLGSRIQYQVRVGEKTFLLELSRGHVWKAAPDATVTIGWDAGDAIVVAP
jgi:spermidine/putrescine transport system ATP-binding protein